MMETIDHPPAAPLAAAGSCSSTGRIVGRIPQRAVFSPLLRPVLLLALLPSLQAGWDDLLQSVNLDATHLTILVGASKQALSQGIQPGQNTVRVRSVTDVFNDKLQIVWQHDATISVYTLPSQARIFTRERWSGAPLAAGWTRGRQVIFWTATPIGDQGFERYPYLLQAVVSLGLKPRAQSRDLWAFFDASYRLRADPEFLASLWRRGGIAGLHIAAWQFWEPDPQRDAWLKALIDACHDHAILVYAWIEFPHVSEKFWQDHPEWREQTATGQDAHLDWRNLMNLADPACDRAIHAGLDSLAARFDWDGINLGELYFESLEGYPNPARFTPFHPSIRQHFSRPPPRSARHRPQHRRTLSGRLPGQTADWRRTPAAGPPRHRSLSSCRPLL